MPQNMLMESAFGHHCLLYPQDMRAFNKISLYMTNHLPLRYVVKVEAQPSASRDGNKFLCGFRATNDNQWGWTCPFQNSFIPTTCIPSDIVEHIAEHREWDFDRVADDQIAMAVEGQWRTYSITLAWSGYDETLRLICTFEMQPPEDKLPLVYDVINRANDKCWTGAFTYWLEQQVMVYRYGLVLTGGQMAGSEQIDCLIASAVNSCERYYPAFQLVAWGDQAPADAMQVAIAGSLRAGVASALARGR